MKRIDFRCRTNELDRGVVVQDVFTVGLAELVSLLA